MEVPEGLPRYIEHTEFSGVTPDGPFMGGHIHIQNGTNPEEAREMIAEADGIDPEHVYVEGANNWPPKGSAGKVYGFSKWAGSKWQPRGPQGNPDLN